MLGLEVPADPSVWRGLVIAVSEGMPFSAALLLVPAGVVMIYLLNAVRIAALVLIGSAGARDIAVGGFHSQAGWIAFNVVALGFSVAARRMPYFTLHPPRAEASARSTDNPTAAYLVPFLVILGAGMFAGALSGKFEWMYPLRFFAAAGALWVFRTRYRRWIGGWVGWDQRSDWLFSHLDRNGPPDGCSCSDGYARPLSASSAATRITWISFPNSGGDRYRSDRRGTRFSRIPSATSDLADFESVPFKHFTWFALSSRPCCSALCTARWPAGILAGLLYSFAMIRRGRIGEAVAAHATTNALLAVYVLAFGQWQYW